MKRILVVDDHEAVRQLLALVLKGKGRELQFATSGEQALQVVRQQRPDLILLDVMMPGGMDGYTVTEKLKADPQLRCPVLIMTAKVQEQDRINAEAAGADDYIGKPFDMRLLNQKVASLLQ
ncbi:MAG: response regulator [Desulfuromonas sp.]|nr:response regulator [Desulfuromonas sp.]